MFTNYLKITFRSLLRHKGYSAINIIGLALGISVCALICLYVVDELSFDKHYANADRIYRVEGDIKFQGQEFSTAVACDPVGPVSKLELPEVEEYVRFRAVGAWNFRRNNQVFREENVGFADSSFFKVFSVPVLQGSAEAALRDVRNVVISESIAKKYFGVENPVGKQLTNDDGQTYTVGAVMQDLPHNTHLPFNILISMSSWSDSRSNAWLSNNYVTYLLLKKGASLRSMEATFASMVKKYVAPLAEKVFQTSYTELIKAGNRYQYSLVPLTSIHLSAGAKVGELSPNGSMQYVWVFSAVAACVLLIACVNFMNLATARAANRAKEVGIRKTLGGQRKNLVVQFLMESSLMVLCALVVAFCLIEIALPTFNTLAGKELSRKMLHSSFFLGLFGGLFLMVSLLAGMYPALVLSRYQPVRVLKGDTSSGSRNRGLRAALVVVQFTASVALVIGTLVIFRQLRFIQTKQLGFQREQVLIVKNPDSRFSQNIVSFKQEVMRLAGVQTATVTNFIPMGSVGSSRNSSPMYAGKGQQGQGKIIQVWSVDADYVPTFSMEMAQGRNFDAKNVSDSTNVIINESLALSLFGTKDVLGKQVTTQFFSSGLETFTVIGVVKDFHYESLRENINPLALFFGKTTGATSIRFEASAAASVLASVEKIWKRTNPNKPFEYQFADDAFDRIYRSEQRIGSIMSVFTSVAIVIACLGLFGLAAFTAEQRTKEIGIRKVLGASVASIIALLSKDFLKLVGIAIILATPLAYWGMGKWLQDFAYRVELTWWMFAAAGVMAVVIAFITVAGQAWRAAQANPVQSLRSE
ncbi:MAG: FtsX-like permease family protein [Candidatus Kapaibacterium sp.]|nr:MAG: FtsX-like permease family protein [Candidatus Kapabacteria bacterium]